MICEYILKVITLIARGTEQSAERIGEWAAGGVPLVSTDIKFV